MGQYLDIQKARFGERLRVTIVVEDDPRIASVPLLLFQPLMENAIRHGLNQRVSSGRIDITARRDGARLVITVTDDGLGAPSNVGSARERVGLGNTRARLEVLYASQHRLDLTNAPERGARVWREILFRAAQVAS